MEQDKSKRFSEKHANKTPDPTIEATISEKTIKGELPCAVAFDIAGRLNVPPSQVGITSDLLNIKISKCQIGLYGYRPENKVASGEKKLNPLVKEALAAAQHNNRITCEIAWEIAARLKVGKIAVGNACEAMKIKVKSCQLGAF